ncbi:MAG: hypothetical protein SFV15_01590 [Polyangiaceae bacterium]|nr:hypothetical protein [Polyangiaceae bacterium]
MAHPQSLTGTANKVASDQKERPAGPTSWIPERQQPLDTEDIDSEWPAEPDENLKLAVAMPQVPKGPSVPADLLRVAEEIDSEWPDAPPEPANVAAQHPVAVPKAPGLPKDLNVAEEANVEAVRRASDDVKPPEVTSPENAKVSGKPSARPLPLVPSHIQDPFVEAKGTRGLLIALMAVVAVAAVLVLVIRSQNHVELPAPQAQRPTAVAATPKAAAPNPDLAPEAKPAPPATVAVMDEEAAKTAPEAAVAPPSAEAGTLAVAGKKPVLIETFPISARVYVIEGTKWIDQGFAPATVEVSSGATLRVMLVKEGFRRRQLKVDGTEARLKVGLVEQIPAPGGNEQATTGEPPAAPPEQAPAVTATP